MIENNINKNVKLAELEVLLFIYGEPINISDIAKNLNLNEKECFDLIQEYDLKLQQEDRGLILLSNNNFFQLGTKPKYSYLIDNLIKKEFNEDLTPASLETLSIILYLGPISKSKIDYLRGVDSGFILRSLMLRGLIERFFDQSNSHAFLYDVSIKLLRYLGVNKKEDLPDYDKFKKIEEPFKSFEKNIENSNFNNKDLLKENI